MNLKLKKSKLKKSKSKLKLKKSKSKKSKKSKSKIKIIKKSSFYDGTEDDNIVKMTWWAVFNDHSKSILYNKMNLLLRSNSQD